MLHRDVTNGELILYIYNEIYISQLYILKRKFNLEKTTLSVGLCAQLLMYCISCFNHSHSGFKQYY